MKILRSMPPFICILAFVGIFLSATAGQAATFYVATNGNDSSPGTEAFPFRTLRKGVRALTPGDTLIVKGGIYHELLLDVIPSGTSWSQPVTVKAASGETVVLQATSKTDGVVAFIGPDTKYVIFDGFTVDANKIGIFALTINDGAAYIRVINCEIKNALASGMLVSSGVEPNELINLDVHDNGSTTFAHGLYLASANNIVEHSRFYRNAGYGIQLFNDAGGVDDNIVRGNLAWANGAGGLWIGKGDRNLVVNNVAWGNGHGMILGSPDAKIYHNTMVANSGTPSAAGAGIILLDDRGVDLANNLAFGNPGGDIHGVQFATVRTNLFGIDPKFVDAAHTDFHLTAQSPAVDKGTPLSLVPTDRDGVPRPQGAGIDIGAYEYSSSSVPTPRNLRVIRQP